MKNNYREQLDSFLNENNKKFSDIIWSGTDDFYISEENLEWILNFNSSFIIEFPIGFKIVGKDFIIIFKNNNLSNELLPLIFIKDITNNKPKINNDFKLPTVYEYETGIEKEVRSFQAYEGYLDENGNEIFKAGDRHVFLISGKYGLKYELEGE